MAAAGQSMVAGDLYVAGTITAKNNVPSAATVGDSQVASGQYVQASKLITQFPLKHAQAPGAAIVAAEELLHAVHGANTNSGICGIVAGYAVIDTPATGADRTVTIDVQKRNGAGAWATILAASLVLNSATSGGVPQALTFSDASLVTGDVLKITVAVAGSAGVQAEGLLVELIVREYPQ